jgi:hypothetical protein
MITELMIKALFTDNTLEIFSRIHGRNTAATGGQRYIGIDWRERRGGHRYIGTDKWARRGGHIYVVKNSVGRHK